MMNKSDELRPESYPSQKLRGAAGPSWRRKYSEKILKEMQVLLPPVTQEIGSCLAFLIRH